MNCMSKATKQHIIVSWCVWELSKRCLEIYEHDHARFLNAPGLACQAALKKTKVKLDLLTDIDMLLMTKKGIKGSKVEYVMLFIDMQKLITSIWKIMIRLKNLYILNMRM